MWLLTITSVVINRALFLQQVASSSPFLLMLPSVLGPEAQDTDTDTSSRITLKEAEEDSKSFRSKITGIIKDDPSLAGPLIRLSFHDATTFEESFTTTLLFPLLKKKVTTGGPNASIQYELERSANRGLQKPLSLVKKVLSEENKNNSLSLADAIALAGASAVEAAGGPAITIRLGRVDVTEADPEFRRKVLQRGTIRSKVETTLPSPGLDSVGMRLYFDSLGFTEQEFVALCGVHGLGRHVSLLKMSKDCLKNLTRACLEDAPVLLPFVTKSVDTFSNSYFQYLIKWNRQDVELGDVQFIPTDVNLIVDSGLRRHVEQFAADEEAFFHVFSRAYQKLVDRF